MPDFSLLFCRRSHRVAISLLFQDSRDTSTGKVILLRKNDIVFERNRLATICSLFARGNMELFQFQLSSVIFFPYCNLVNNIISRYAFGKLTLASSISARRTFSKQSFRQVQIYFAVQTSQG